MQGVRHGDDLGQQCREHTDANAGQRQQDGRVGRRGRYVWISLGRGIRFLLRSCLGQLTHPPMELAAHIVKLPVDQGETFRHQTHVRRGGEAAMAFDGVPIGIGDGLPKNRHFRSGLFPGLGGCRIPRPKAVQARLTGTTWLQVFI